MKQPKEAVTVSEEKPAKFIQGYEWSTVPGVDEKLELCLWNAGILTIEDLNNTQAIVGALMVYHGLDVSNLRQKIKEHLNV